jgi:hypothetical protein
MYRHVLEATDVPGFGGEDGGVMYLEAMPQVDILLRHG